MTTYGNGWIGNWSPGIGDPTPMGWMTVVLYAITALLCHRVIKNEHKLRPSLEADEKRLWQWFVFALVFLTINKQLDLQSALTEVGRLVARVQDWYEHRRDFQMVFISVIGLFGLMVLAAFLLMARQAPCATWIALFGGVFLVAFVVIRATSFHHVDYLLFRRSLARMRLNWVMEIGALLLIAGGAWKRTLGLSDAMTNRLKSVGVADREHKSPEPRTSVVSGPD